MSPRAAAKLLFAVLAGLFLLSAGNEFRNVSGSPFVRRYLFLALLCLVLALVLYVDPLQYLRPLTPR